MTPFEVDVVDLGDRAVVVTVVGRVGAREGAELAETMATGRPAVERVVVDLADAQVVDASALIALYDAALVVLPAGGAVAVVVGRDATLRRVLEASGLDVAFRLHETRDAALADLGLEGRAG